MKDIHPRPLAKFLCKFVYKTPYGIGLGSPWTMELAIRDIGRPKILFAALCSAITKPFGVRGVFYKIVGDKGRAIDGPCEYTLPPYNHYAKLAPENPDQVAAELQSYTGCQVVIIDANDLGCEVLGRSGPDVDVALCKQIFSDNPLGQESQQTPMAIVRKAETEQENPDAAAQAVPLDAENGVPVDGQEETPDTPDTAVPSDVMETETETDMPEEENA